MLLGPRDLAVEDDRGDEAGACAEDALEVTLGTRAKAGRIVGELLNAVLAHGLGHALGGLAQGAAHAAPPLQVGQGGASALGVGVVVKALVRDVIARVQGAVLVLGPPGLETGLDEPVREHVLGRLGRRVQLAPPRMTSHLGVRLLHPETFAVQGLGEERVLVPVDQQGQDILALGHGKDVHGVRWEAWIIRREETTTGSTHHAGARLPPRVRRNGLRLINEGSRDPFNGAHGAGARRRLGQTTEEKLGTVSPGDLPGGRSKVVERTEPVRPCPRCLAEARSSNRPRTS